MFLVVDYSFAYNAILRRPTLNSWNAVTSTYHLMIKFPTEYRVGEVRRDQVAARKCYIAMLEMDNHVQTITLNTSERWQSPLKDLKRFFLTTPGQIRQQVSAPSPTQWFAKHSQLFLKRTRMYLPWAIKTCQESTLRSWCTGWTFRSLFHSFVRRSRCSPKNETEL